MKLIKYFLVVFFLAIAQTSYAASVDLKVNGADDILTVGRGADLKLTWDSSGVTGCSILGKLLPQEFGVHTFSKLSTKGTLNTSAYTALVPYSFWEDPQWFVYYITCSTGYSTVEDIVSVLVAENKKQLTVTSPVEGSAYVAGKKMKIKWESDKKKVKKVDIVLVRKGDGTVQVASSDYVINNKKNTNSYTWKIPKDITPGSYQLIVGEPAGDASRAQYTTGWFTITNPNILVPIPISTSKTLGITGATVMEAYLDFQDPYSRYWYTNTLPRIKTDYVDTGKIQLVFKNFGIYEDSIERAVAGECAAQQGRFFEMVSQLYADIEADYKRKGFVTLAKNIGLNTRTFENCFKNSAVTKRIKRESAAAKVQGYQAVPAFTFKGQTMYGAQAYSEFQKVLN